MSWKVMSARRFDEHAAAWQALNNRGPKSALLDVRFVGPLLEAFGTGRELLAIKGDPRAPTAMAILQPCGLGRFETFQPSQAPIGAWVSDERNAPSEKVLSALLRRLPGMAISCGITQIDPALVARPAATRRLQTLDYIRTAYVPVEGAFEEYWAARGSNLRKNHRRRRHRLADSGISPRLEAVTAPASMAQAVADYGVLETKGWKAGTGTAVSADNAQGRFYTRMLEAFAERGEAVVYRYWYGDRLAASDICICRDDILIVLKTTYDEDLAETSPAMLMREEEFARIFESKTIHRIEFYGKVMDWHTKWTDEVRTMYHVTEFRWAFVPRLLARLRKSKAEPVETPAAADAPVPATVG
jgi:CelD/BcsL family acetyltransferase involved in cellulose biosynthesis